MTSKVLSATDPRGVATVTINRPDRHNAFDGETIDGLEQAFGILARDPTVRAIVLTGAGGTFCAGADVGHMRAMMQASEQANVEDALRLARLLRQLGDLDKPLIARVNGSAFGGAVGLIACCDIAVAVEDAMFALSEVRLGLVPATISPWVVAALGVRQARRLFLSAERLDAARALDIGLLHFVCSRDALDATVTQQVELLLQGGPHALAECKKLVRRIAGDDRATRDAIELYTARLLARIRVSPEAQEGLGAFFDKRKPAWTG